MSANKFTMALGQADRENDLVTIKTYCGTNQKRGAVIFHTHMLNPEFADENIHTTQQGNMREAAAVIHEQIDPLLVDGTGKMFFFDNGAILYIVKNYNEETHNRICMNIEKRLVAIDLWSKKFPILMDTQVVSKYELPEESKQLYYDVVRITQLSLLNEARIKEEEMIKTAKKKGNHQAIRPDQIISLQGFFKASDVTSFVNYQDVYLVKNFYQPKPVFCEFSLSTDKIVDQLLPSVDVQENKWFFRYITRMFDSVLFRASLEHKMMKRDFITPTINMNISSMLNSDFLNQLSQYNAMYSRRVLMIELHISDILSSYNDYLTMRQELEDYDNVIFALDGVTNDHVELIDNKLSGAHMLKIHPTQQMEDLPPREKLDILSKMVEAFNPERCIFCHCTNERLYQLALSAGFILFQGKYIDMIETSRLYADRNSFM